MKKLIAVVSLSLLSWAFSASPAHSSYIDIDHGNALLAHAFFPPPNGSSAAGDIHFSNAFNWGDGTGIDFETVALHELGHSLGLSHSNQPGSIMQPFYSGVQTTLSADDIDCIRSIYGTAGGACDGGNIDGRSWPEAPLTLSVMPAGSVVEDGTLTSFDFAGLYAGDEAARVNSALNTWLGVLVGSGLSNGGFVLDDGSDFNASSGSFGDIRLAAVNFTIPEPTTMFLAGFGMLLALLRRR